MKKYLLGKIIRFIKEWHLLRGGEGVLLAISGGADSVFMVEMFEDISRIFKLRLECVHVNHGLRGEESDRDERFVRDYCKKKGIHLTVRYIKDLDMSESGIEERARERRYRIFYEVLKERNLDVVSTAHSMDDLVETVVFNLLRGTGISGASGIPPKKDRVIRPLLTVERKEIESYLNASKVEYMIDSTNRDVKYSRNFIRNAIIPLFYRVNPAHKKHIFHFSLILRNMEEWSRGKLSQLESRIKHCSKYACVYNLAGIDLPDIVFVSLLGSYILSPSYEEIFNYLGMLHDGKGRVSIRGIEISYSRGELAFLLENYSVMEEFRSPEDSVIEEVMNYRVKVVEGKAQGNMECQIDESYFPFVIRNKNNGDKISGKKLKDRFIDLKIPYWRRRFWPVFEKDGVIFFVPGVYKKESKEGTLKLEVKKNDRERFSIFD